MQRDKNHILYFYRKAEFVEMQFLSYQIFNWKAILNPFDLNLKRGPLRDFKRRVGHRYKPEPFFKSFVNYRLSLKRSDLYILVESWFYKSKLRENKDFNCLDFSETSWSKKKFYLEKSDFNIDKSRTFQECSINLHYF